MATVGVRDLKNRLSEFLRRVADGERITVTDRGRPIAVLGPPDATPDDALDAAAAREGLPLLRGRRRHHPRHRVTLPARDSIRR
jgi:prevent-host-death family protein